MAHSVHKKPAHDRGESSVFVVAAVCRRCYALSVRWLFFWILSATAIGFLPAAAEENIVQEFSGSGSTTTGLVKVQDRWEVRWNARQVVSVAVMSADGTIVAGAAGVLRGSLFVPAGGQYYFKISDGTVAPPSATIEAPAADTTAPPVAGTNAAPSADTNAPPIAGTNAAPSAATNAPPVAGTNAAPIAATNAPSAVPPPAAPLIATPPQPETAVSWHLQVVELGMSVASNQALTVYTPFFIVPDSAVTAVAPPPELPPPVLTDEQIRAVVAIKGDNAQGAGFLMRSPEGVFVVTHLHLLAGNPNIKIFTNSGATITTLSLKGAVDRDLAMFAIQDDHYSYLSLPADPANGVAQGDQVIIPNINQQADVLEVLSGRPGKVIAIGPERLDFDNVVGPGSSGAPVIHVKSGKVLALVTAVKRVDLSDDIAQAWAANPAPGSSGIIPYFGLRLSGVQGWETYDWSRFLAETLFLTQFHKDTRCLDSFLNGKRRWIRRGGEGEVPPDTRYFLNNPTLRKAHESYQQLANGADQNQRLDAARELLFDVQSVADSGVSTLQSSNYAYAYDRTWVQEELAYRKALKKELDDVSSNIVRFDNIARTR
jgi:hypothetical protein